MSIRTRILALVGCFALMAFAVTGLGLVTISDYNHILKKYDRDYADMWRGERFNHLISNIVMETRGLYNATDQTQRMVFVKGLNSNLDDIEVFISDWESKASPEEKPTIHQLALQTHDFVALRRKVSAFATNGDVVSAQALSISNRPSRIAFQAKVEALVQSTHATLEKTKASTENYSHRRAGDFLLTALLGIAIIMGLSLWIVAHFITAPLRNLSSAIIKTSKGEYDVVMDDIKGKDEVSSLWRALAVLKERSIEAERLAAIKADADREQDRKMREILLD